MENLLKRLELVEKYCSEEYNDLYYKLLKCRDKAIGMSFAEYMSGEKEHDYSNLYSCVYDFKKENNVLESMEELMQLMKDIDFNIDKKWVEKKLKKRSIKTDNGFDIKGNLVDFEDPMKYSVRQNEDGTVDIVIKNVSFFEEK